MRTINRAVVIIRKKKPFFDWLKSLPDGHNLPGAREDLSAGEPDCYLIDASESDEVLLKRLRQHSVAIFEHQMDGWWTDEKDWEQDLSWKNFRRWFDYEIASL